MNLDQIKTQCNIILGIINQIQNSSDKGEVNDWFIHLEAAIEDLQEVLKSD